MAGIEGNILNPGDRSQMGRWAGEGREGKGCAATGRERGPGNEMMSAPPVTKQKVTLNGYSASNGAIGATSTIEKAVKVAER